MNYMGIDPGWSGGVAILNEESLVAYPMPETEKDLWMLIHITRETHGFIDKALIERVHSFPGQGVASSFKFGVNYGLLRMALIGTAIPFEEVRPLDWQRGLSLSGKKKGETVRQWKNRLKAKAQQLYPSAKISLAIADAVLIATYCRRKEQGRL